MAQNNGGPAFPSLEIYEAWDHDSERYEVKSDTATGMSLRDYFAAVALQGLMAYSGGVPNDADKSRRAALVRSEISAEAYLMADAMLAARDASQSGAR